MANDRPNPWLGWVAAALMGTAVLAPQLGGEKPSTPVTSQAAEREHRSGRDEAGTPDDALADTTLSPLGRFLQARRLPPRLAGKDIALRGDQGKATVEVRGEALSTLESLRSRWKDAHRALAGGPANSMDLLAMCPNLRLLLVCLPDPDYPDLLGVHDLYLQAVKQQLHRSGWLFAGHWYPEMEGQGRTPDAFRLHPRSLLFSRPLLAPREWDATSGMQTERPLPAADHELLLVLLLPENPTQGIQRPRLRVALNLVRRWQDAGPAIADQGRSQRHESARCKAKQDAASFVEWFGKQVPSLPTGSPKAQSWNQLREQILQACGPSASGTEAPLWRFPQESDRQDVWDSWIARIRTFESNWNSLLEGDRQAPLGRDLARGPASGEMRRFLQRLWARAWEARDGTRTLKVLGPFFSGSAQALAEELSGKALVPWRPNSLVVSPTSTARAVRTDTYWPAGVTSMFLAPRDESDLSNLLWDGLSRGLGRPPQAWAFIKEADTTFGGVSGNWEPAPDEGSRWVYRLPAHLSSLRQAKGKEDQSGPDLAGPLRAALSRLRPLSPDWSSEGSSPEISPLQPHPAASLDLELQALIQDLKRREIKAAYISMSSLPNTVFIARQLRLHMPDLILATPILHVDLLHPEVARELEGLYAFSFHSPYPDLWRLEDFPDGADLPGPHFADPKEPTAIAHSSIPLIREAVWLLEHAFLDGTHGAHRWSLREPPSGPLAYQWFFASDRRWTFRRSMFISQLRHGQFRPTMGALEALETSMAPGDQVQLASAELDPPSLAVHKDRFRLTRAFLAVGRLQRFYLPLLVLALLAVAYWHRGFREESTSRYLADVERSRTLRFRLLQGLLPPLLLVAQASCLISCFWVFRKAAGSIFTLSGLLSFPVIESLLMLGACGMSIWVALSLARQWETSRGRTFDRPPAHPWSAGIRARAAYLLLTVVPVGLLVASVLVRKGPPASTNGRSDLFEPIFHTLAGLEPLTGLAYLPSLLCVCAFLALALRFEEQRIFHLQLNASLASPVGWLTPSAVPTGSARAFWDPALLLVVPGLLLRPLLDGSFSATRILPFLEQRVLGVLLGLGFMALSAYTVHQFRLAMKSWKRLKRESLLLEVAPWREQYAWVGTQWSWRPTRGLGPFHTDNRSLPFALIRSLLNATPVPRRERSRIATLSLDLASPSLRKSDEVECTRKLDQALLPVLGSLPSPRGETENRLLALCTYHYFKRSLAEIRIQVLHSFAASFAFLFGCAAGLQGSQSLVLFALVGIAVQVLFAFRLILDVEGNGLFSAVAGTAPGKPNWNQDTWSALLKPAALALLALLVARFPALGAALASVILH